MAFLTDKPQEVCRDHYLLKIDIDQKNSSPGQFANIKIGENDPLLRRPFSIFNHNGNIIDIVFKVVGKGTTLLRDINKTGYIDVIAPLGKGFTITENKKALLIGGGVGNAPLYYLAKMLRNNKNEVHYLYAAKAKEFIFKKKEFKSLADKFFLCTDDGSDGEKGLAGDVALEILQKEKYNIIYTCGPAIMMKNIVNIVQNFETPIEVSLENYFGCGIGLCYGCTVETTDGMKRACINGPVLDGKKILWDSLVQ